MTGLQCDDEANWHSFLQSNNEWKFITNNDGSKTLLGTFTYADWGIPGLKMITYFRKASDKSRAVTATLMVGENGTSAGEVPYCGGNGLDLSNATTECRSGVEYQSIDASICKPLYYNDSTRWIQEKDSAGKVISYTHTTGSCAIKSVSISPENVSNFTQATLYFTVSNPLPSDTEICYKVVQHVAVPSAVSGSDYCSKDSDWTEIPADNPDWTAGTNGWTGKIAWSPEMWDNKGIVVEMSFRSKSNH